MKHIIEWSLFESVGYRLPLDVSDKLTTDGEGNYLFYHYSKAKRDLIRPGTGQNIITSSDEASALSSVGGLAMYYTSPNYAEPGVGNFRHIVKVPNNKVYDFNSDTEYFYEQCLDEFRKLYNGVDRPKLGFSPNYQLAWITRMANQKGYDMVVARWKNTLRAQTTLSLVPYIID